jgi:hypothetical protein
MVAKKEFSQKRIFDERKFIFTDASNFYCYKSPSFIFLISFLSPNILLIPLK